MRVASGLPIPEPRVDADRHAELVRGARRLGGNIEAALQTLGQAFLDHPDNAALRAALNDSESSATSYLAELLGLVYRCVFLCCAQARGCLHPRGSLPAARARYARRLACLRGAPSLPASATPLFTDAPTSLWAALQAVFRGLERGEPRLGLPALGGVFGSARCPRLDAARLEDAALLRAFAQLEGRAGQGESGPIDWADVSPELLGSAYEQLLALEPRLRVCAGELRWHTRDERGAGLRRSTGGYYTPPHLVQALLDAALEPLVRQTLAAGPARPAQALAELSIVDPACGSGYFLLAAARRLASHVARCSPAADPLDPVSALRRVVQSCLFGVDLNPIAVEICRLGLWLEVGDASLPLRHFDARIVQGNSLIGASPELLGGGVPDGAWKALPGEDKQLARALERRNRAPAPEPSLLPPPLTRELADAWCAAFFWPRQPAAAASAPTNELWRPALEGRAELPQATRELAAELAAQHHFFHWQLAFPDVFARGGFDLVLGNPPWIAHAGRASQRLPGSVKRFFECNYESFADYPTTHGVFVQVAAGALRVGGYLGLVIPSSLSELGGYAPTRTAHDRLCEFPAELIDFGEGQFSGVTQPCMALVSRRAAGGRRDRAAGDPWPMQRSDLDHAARALLERLAQLSSLPPELFGERGVQSDRRLLQHFLASAEPVGRFEAPIREGTDVREFELAAPRWHVDPSALGARMRGADEFARVRVLVRQTARFPIAALSDGLAFRNSLLAGFETPDWPAPALVALLNSTLIRWLHYMRFRDARQPILPQLKISHLRAIPAPPRAGSARRLAGFGERWRGPEQRAELDELVFTSYGLAAAECEIVTRWHEQLAQRRPRASKRGRGD